MEAHRDQAVREADILATYTRLVTITQRLDRLSSAVIRLQEIEQRARDLLSQGLTEDDFSRELALMYRPWFTETLPHLDDDLAQMFRKEFEGSSMYPKIKSVIEAPSRSPQARKLVAQLAATAGTWDEQLHRKLFNPLTTQHDLIVEGSGRIRALIQGEGTHVEILDRLEVIGRRLPRALRQLATASRNWYARPLINEYDLQHSLWGILMSHFDDVRPEEPTPSHAGSSARSDFLLKTERVMVEAKMTRDGLRNKNLKSELLNDIATYKTHPDAGALFVFVYDPRHHIDNPLGFETDFRDDGVFPVRVVIGL